MSHKIQGRIRLAGRLSHNLEFARRAFRTVMTGARGWYAAPPRNTRGWKIEIDGNRVRVSWHKSLPLPVFLCSLCDQDYRIYEAHGVWACRKCHRFDYACRHRNRSISGSVRSLRRRIGASLVLFSSIEPKPRNARRYWCIVCEIRQLEEGLIGHAREDVGDVLQKRHDRGRGQRNRSGGS